MNEETLTALKKSIEHWKRLSTGTQKAKENIGPSSCALCALFITPNFSCAGCPVAKHSGQEMCFNTPYLKAKEQLRVFGLNSLEFKQAANYELLYLQKLIPL